MNKPNKTELEYFIRYSLDSGKYKRYMELYEEIERLHSIIKEVRERLMKANIYRNYDDEEDDTHYTDLNIEEVLEILDKENNKTNEVMSVEELEEYEPKNMAEQEYQDWFWEGE